MMIKFSQNEHVTRPPFRKQLHLGDLIMAKYQVLKWILTLLWIHEPIHWLDQLLQDVQNPG